MSGDPGTPPPRQRNAGAWLLAITALALVVRLAGLNSGLWLDEIYSLLQSFRAPLGQTLTEYPADTHHPLYSVLARLSLLLFGDHPWTIRLPAALFGAATVPLLFALAAQFLSRREALLSAALLAVSYHHVWFSQNARGYALLGFFAVAGALLLLKGLEDGGWRWFLLYGVAMALGAYTHLTFVFVVVGHAAACVLFVLLKRSARNRAVIQRLFVAFALSAVVTVLLYAPMIGDVLEFFGNRPSQLRGISTPAWAAAETVRVMLAGLGGVGASVAVAAGLFGMALMAAGMIGMLRSDPLALGLFLLPVAVTLAGALAARGTMYPRFFFSLAGYFVIIAVHGAFELARLATRRAPHAFRATRARRLGSAAAGLMIVVSALSLLRVWRYPKQDFDGARRWVETRRQAGDTVATVGVTVVPYRDWLRTDWAPVTSETELSALRGRGRVWLVYAFPRYLARAAGDVLAVTERECDDAEVFPGTLGGGDVYVCLLGPRP